MRGLLAAAPAERQARLDAGRVDAAFRVGDRALLRTKERLDAAGIGKLRPRRDGPFTVTACPSPDPYTRALPRRMRCSPAANVDRPKPSFALYAQRIRRRCIRRRSAYVGGAVNVDRPRPSFERAGAGLVSDSGQEGQREAELLLHRTLVRGLVRRLVRWRDTRGAVRAPPQAGVRRSAPPGALAGPRAHARSHALFLSWIAPPLLRPGALAGPRVGG